MSVSIADTVSLALARLQSWLECNGWAGYDPYDIHGTGWYMGLAQAQSLPVRAIRKVVMSLVDRYPLITRRLARVKAISPKGMGLLTTAFCRLFEATGNKVYLERAMECADWLLEHPSQGYPGLSWGYPFDWQSKVFIPKWTPSAVVSTIVGDGLWHLAHSTGKARYLNACAEICEFLLQGLNRTVIDHQTLCFSYTPVDNFLVHNANLFAAEYLARVGKYLGKSEWCDISIRAGNFALREQNEDGSIFYWGRAQNHHAPNHLDCYHSGFEIRSLWALWETTEDVRFRQSAVKYLDFFYLAYIGSDGSVMTRPGVVFPVDIHACAEALLCLAVLSSVDFERFLTTVSAVLPWVLNLMQNIDGSFAYMAFKDGRVDRTPYIRWGQAWMLRALAEVRFVLRSRG